MVWIDCIFREIKARGWLRELNRIQLIKERYKKLNEILINLNISKEPLSFYTRDEQLYLLHKVQKAGVDMGLCSGFYIFFSKRNKKYHYLCRTKGKEKRAFCYGRKERCDEMYVKGEYSK